MSVGAEACMAMASSALGPELGFDNPCRVNLQACSPTRVLNVISCRASLPTASGLHPCLSKVAGGGGWSAFSGHGCLARKAQYILDSRVAGSGKSDKSRSLHPLFPELLFEVNHEFLFNPKYEQDIDCLQNLDKMPVRLFGSVAFDPPPQKGLIKKVALGKTKRPPIDPSRFPRKWGYASDHVLKEKRHYGAGNTDFFEKQRLCARDFSFQRHPWYSNLVDQKKDSLAYEGDRYERFRRDTAGMLKAERHNARRKQEAMYQEWRNIKMCREYDLRTGREELFLKQEKQDAERRKNIGNISNKNSTAYNPITLQYHDGYEGDKLTYEDKATKWRQAMRSIYLQKKINGDRKFNWMGWTPRPAIVEPIKPLEPKPYCRSPKRIDIEVNDG